MLVLLRRTSFPTTFYGLYFSHPYTLQLQILNGPLRAAFHVLHQLPSFDMWALIQVLSPVLCVDSHMYMSGGVPQVEVGQHLGPDIVDGSSWRCEPVDICEGTDMF